MLNDMRILHPFQVPSATVGCYLAAKCGVISVASGMFLNLSKGGTTRNKCGATLEFLYTGIINKTIYSFYVC